MAKAASKATSLTTLKIGSIEVPVGLFSTTEKPGKLAEFTTAGPSGGVLKAEAVARAVPVDEPPAETVDAPVHSDPLAEDGHHELVELGPAAGERDTWLEPQPPGRPMLDQATSYTLGVDARGVGFGCSPERSAEGLVRAAEAPVAVDGEYGRQLVEEGTGEVVEPQDVRRGVRLEDGRFIDCTGQLAEIDRQTKLDRMEVIGFVDVSQIPRARVRNAYYVGAGDEKAPRALRIIFEGLRATRRGAVVKLTKKTRQSLGVIGWLKGALVLYELVWSEDVRPAPERASRIQKEKVSSGEVQMFVQLVRAMALPADALAELRDDALELRERLMAKALAGEVPEVLTPAPAIAAQDVLAQLEASLAAVGS